MKFDQKACGMRIRELRLQRGLTQFQFAEQMGLYEKHISKMELGIHGISLDLLIEICEFFDVTTDHLLFGHSKNNDEFAAEYLDIVERMLALKKRL